MEKKSDKSGLGISFFLSFFLIVILILAIGFFDLRQIVTYNNIDQAELITRLLAKNLNESLDGVVFGVEQLSDVIAANTDRSVETMYNEILVYKEKSLFQSMGLIDRDLKIYGEERISPDLTTKMNIRELFDSESAYITEPYRSSLSAEMVFTVFSPVIIDGNTDFLIYGTFALNTLQQFADVDRIGVDADIYLLDADSYNIITCRTNDDTSSGSWGSLMFDHSRMKFEGDEGYRSYIANLKNREDSFSTIFTMDDEKYTQCNEKINNMDGWYLTVRISDHSLSSSQARFRTRVTVYSIIIVFVTLLFAAGIILNIARQKKVFEALSVTDTMTGLLNKKSFESLTDDYIKKVKDPGILAFVDIDDFKKYNDNYGHQNGDRVIKKLAGELKKEFGRKGYVGRYGGDEFIVFVKNTADRESLKVAMDRIRKELSDTELEGYGKVAISFSAGAAVYPTDAENYADICNAADKALYEVKEAGKGKLYFV